MLLLAWGHIGGLALHALLGGSPDVPCVGASAGISAVIACYAIAFPQVRLLILFRYFLYFRWLRLRAWMALIAFTAMQCLGAAVAYVGIGGVAYYAHLGGLIVGAAGAFYQRRVSARTVAESLSASREPEALRA